MAVPRKEKCFHPDGPHTLSTLCGIMRREGKEEEKKSGNDGGEAKIYKTVQSNKDKKMNFLKYTYSIHLLTCKMNQSLSKRQKKNYFLRVSFFFLKC
jgi:hypothetical protein